MAIRPPSLSRGVFGWDACRLADEYSADELGAAAVWLLNEPSCKNPDHAAGKSIWLLSAKARKASEAIGWAVFYKHQAAAADMTR